MWRWIGVPACRLRIESNFRTACQAFSQADHPPTLLVAQHVMGLSSKALKTRLCFTCSRTTRCGAPGARRANGVRMVTKSKGLLISPLLVLISAAMALSAAAQEQTNHPPPKAQAVRPRAPAAAHPPMGPGRPMAGPGHPGGPGVRGVPASSGPHFAHDRRLWGGRERQAWAGGHWRPYECRFGRCGYWWLAGGYWYFYDQPMEGPPDVVSDYEYADPSIEQVEAPPSGGEYGPPPPGGEYVPPPPPPPGQGVVGGAVGGAVVGGILGGVLTGRPGGAAAGAIIGGTTGAAIGAQAEQRHGYYLWQGVCYYRYPTGQYAAVDPRYCN
jgi:hypothetical protein